MQDSIIQEAISQLSDIRDDEDSSKKLVEKIVEVIEILSEDSELSISQALDKLEEASELDITSYVRTQIWDVVSLLESFNSNYNADEESLAMDE